MKGKLKKTDKGWVVRHPVATNFQHTYYNIRPYLEKYYFLDEDAEGSEVEFEIEDFWETGGDEGIKLAKLIAAKEQTNGERFEEFMRTVESYPELEGTMNICEDIIEKKTGKMIEEEWQAAERAQTSRMYSEDDMKLSFDAGIRKAHSSKKHSECWKEWFEQFKKK
jgi:hypothetical protein